MSEYTQFFVRNGDNFLPIGTYCRGTKVAEAFRYIAPYEAIKPLTVSNLRSARDELREQIRDYDKSIEREREEIDFLRSCEMDNDERMERYHDATEMINDCSDFKDECAHALSFIGFLEDILEEVETERKFGENPLQLNENSYVYVGIEVGYPTIENIRD